MQPHASPPAISVIVRSMDRPVLDRALASIAAQDVQGVAAEVLVVAASGAGHRPVPAAIGPFEGRLVASAQPLARPRAANAGLAAARGTFITFLDDDDELLPGQFSALMGALEADPGAGLAHGRSLAVDDRGNLLYVYGGPWIAWRQLNHGFFQLGAVMLRRELLERGVRFDESLEILEDLEFFVQCAQVARFRYVATPVSRYHVTEGTSGTGEEGNRDQARVQRALAYIRAKWSALALELERSPPAVLERARDLIRRGESAQAAAALAPLAEARDAEPETLNLMGVAQTQLGRFDLARGFLERALALAPGDAGLRRNLEILERKRQA